MVTMATPWEWPLSREDARRRLLILYELELQHAAACPPHASPSWCPTVLPSTSLADWEIIDDMVFDQARATASPALFERIGDSEDLDATSRIGDSEGSGDTVDLDATSPVLFERIDDTEDLAATSPVLPEGSGDTEDPDATCPGLFERIDDSVDLDATSALCERSDDTADLIASSSASSERSDRLDRVDDTMHFLDAHAAAVCGARGTAACAVAQAIAHTNGQLAALLGITPAELRLSPSAPRAPRHRPSWADMLDSCASEAGSDHTSATMQNVPESDQWWPDEVDLVGTCFDWDGHADHGALSTTDLAGLDDSHIAGASFGFSAAAGTSMLVAEEYAADVAEDLASAAPQPPSPGGKNKKSRKKGSPPLPVGLASHPRKPRGQRLEPTLPDNGEAPRHNVRCAPCSARLDAHQGAAGPGIAAALLDAAASGASLYADATPVSSVIASPVLPTLLLEALDAPSTLGAAAPPQHAAAQGAAVAALDPSVATLPELHPAPSSPVAAPVFFAASPVLHTPLTEPSAE